MGRAIVLCGLWIAVIGLLPTAAQARVGFTAAELEIENEKLFDLSVADYDADGLLDVATTNHSRAASLLHNGGNRHFTERIDATGLHHDALFPGLAALGEAPRQTAAGLYIYGRPGGAYEVRRVGDPGPGSISGAIDFRTGVHVRERVDAVVDRRRLRVDGPDVRRIRFGLPRPGSRVLLDPGFLDAPVFALIDEPLARERIFVGSDAVVPPGRLFRLRLPDRHGIAFADIDGDGRRDAWVVSGGNKGKISELEGLIEDELFFSDGARFVERRAEAGISKGRCRGRTAETPDYDGDGRLDLFASCAGGTPKLYRQVAPRRFRDVSPLLASQRRMRGSEHRWFDLVGDRRPELIVARRHKLHLFAFKPRAGAFRRVDSVPRKPRGVVRRLLVSDFDRDGDPDVFAASPGASLLAVNTGSGLRAVRPKDVGLPKHSAAASWVDFNNDGRVDLHSVPHGLYRQRRDGTFAPTGRARVPEAGKVFAPNAWLDAENDGDRDLLIAYKEGGELERRVRLFSTRGVRGHWLAVDLRGRAPNTDALGAEVRLRAGRERLTGFVGESESSRHSRGHYRIYFGLGRRQRVDRLRVRWPDGSKTVRRDLDADRLLEIEQ